MVGVNEYLISLYFRERYNWDGVCVDVGEGVAPMDRVGVGVEGNDSVKVKVSV